MPTSRLGLLSSGAHLSPEVGACLMEVVSVHAGERWSDAPSCTHPLLAHLARLVNDASSDPARQELLQYVGALASATGEAESTHPRVALACTSVALRHQRSVVLLHLERAAHAELRRQAAGHGATHARRWTRRLAGWTYRHGAAFRSVELAVAAVAGAPEDVRDEALDEMLSAALVEVAETATRVP